MKDKKLINHLLVAGLMSLGMTAPNWAYALGWLPAAVTDGDYFNQGVPNQAKVELGKNLFFDKILSGNKNDSCATCHHVLTDTSDGLSLPVGEGGRGLGVTRNTGEFADDIPERVPRNAPAVFNLGALEFTTMFHDGRLRQDPSYIPSGYESPAGDDFPAGLDNALAAQAMFPVTSGTEMAGQRHENPIADAAADGYLPLLWQLLAERLQATPEYVEMFMAAYPEIQVPEDITFVHAANAIGAFEAEAWRADNSPFDRFLRGERHAMSHSAEMGMKLFYGKAGCSDCHSGAFQTDHQYHAIAMPQIGPGKGNGTLGTENYGRELVTGDPANRYQFRTPSLRNVALTGPWGHDGAYNSLEAVVSHHLNSVDSLYSYDESQTVLPDFANAEDFTATHDPEVLYAIGEANELNPLHLNSKQISNLMDFLNALTDPGSIDLRKDIPRRVPSGLTLAE